MNTSSSRVYKNPENYDFNCFCGRNFSLRKNFNAHRKKVHGDSVSTSAKNTKTKNCVLCSFESDDKNKMVRHFQVVHDISITQEKLRFTTKDEFMSWKNKVEHETLSQYIKKRGSTQYKAYITSIYICNRSGYYNPTTKGIRHSKAQGSCKINGFCPANITMKLQKSDGSCSVSYTATHVGHKNELIYLSLPITELITERENIATKISMKIEPEDIDFVLIDDQENSSEKNIQELSRKKTDESFQKRKESLIKEYIDTINNISIPEQLDYMEHNFASLKPTLASIKETTDNNRENSLNPKSNTNTKNIAPQRNFFLQKKKTKKNFGMS